jgi:hypothetical protein
MTGVATGGVRGVTGSLGTLALGAGALGLGTTGTGTTGWGTPETCGCGEAGLTLLLTSGLVTSGFVTSGCVLLPVPPSSGFHWTGLFSFCIFHHSSCIHRLRRGIGQSRWAVGTDDNDHSVPCRAACRGVAFFVLHIFTHVARQSCALIAQNRFVF